MCWIPLNEAKPFSIEMAYENVGNVESDYVECMVHVVPNIDDDQNLDIDANEDRPKQFVQRTFMQALMEKPGWCMMLPCLS